MKKRKMILFTMITLFLFTGIVGCEKEPEYEIHENHEVSACGVEDPLRNIEWLRKYCENIVAKKNVSEVTIYLYKIKDKEEHIFAICFPSIDEYFASSYNNCDGDEVFYWDSVTPPSPACEEFMQDKEFVAELFHFSKK